MNAIPKKESVSKKTDVVNFSPVINTSANLSAEELSKMILSGLQRQAFARM